MTSEDNNNQSVPIVVAHILSYKLLNNSSEDATILFISIK